MMDAKVHDPDGLASAVQTYYTARLASGTCCGPARAVATDAELEVPSFGCGDPTTVAELAPGERVLDLGSGAGLDAFRAAEAVGPSGRVIGVDMTPAMLERARAGAARLGLSTVEFREGRIEALPVDDASVDVVISNCVINLSGDKAAVFREVERVLVPGGRMTVSDELVHGRHLTAPSADGWCGCVDGAVDAATYAAHARAAGLVDVRVEPAEPPVPYGRTYTATVRARKAPVRPAGPDDADAAARLLAQEGLPTEGWGDPTTRRWVLVDGGVLVGAVGIEVHGDEALLRSLAVAPGARGRGYASALVRAALRGALDAGAGHAHALTTTIPGLLEGWGFDEIARDAVPAALHASPELRGACPESARVFRIGLGRAERRDAGARPGGS